MTKLSKNDIIKDVEEAHESLGLKKSKEKRVYRKRETWNNPDKPQYAEENRIKKRFTVRANPELLEEIEKAAEKAGLSRQDWIEQACRAALERN